MLECALEMRTFHHAREAAGGVPRTRAGEGCGTLKAGPDPSHQIESSDSVASRVPHLSKRMEYAQL